MNKHKLSYLALGDSYTIGEGVEASERYPNQLVELLRKNKRDFSVPLTIAKTGWTTDELSHGITEAGIKDNTYDLVTLLIGVNNQYRGRPVDNYEKEFRTLLQNAIGFAKDNPKHVIVLSIPDWGITPFAVERGTDQEKVTHEINQYNAAKRKISETLGVHYIDITEEYRKVGARPEMLVSDKLHPSGLVYRHWAEKLNDLINTESIHE